MNYSLQDLKNKSVLITGASAGIGQAIAKFLGESGVKLYLVARREEPLAEICQNYTGSYVVGDINQNSTLEKMQASGFFDCDILINNAGMAIGKEYLENMPDEDIELMVQTNLISAFKITKRCGKKMRERGEGDIVNIVSIASQFSYAGGSIYCPTKFALRSMGESLRHEFFGTNIRVINIHPGMVETEFSKVRFGGDEKKAKSIYEGMSPLTPDDIAYQVLNALKAPRHVNMDDIYILAREQIGVEKVFRKND